MIKSLYKITITFLLLIFVVNNSIIAQVSYGGNPYFTGPKGLEKNGMSVRRLSYAPSKTQLNELSNYKNGQPLTFAHEYNVCYTPDNSGKWSVMEDGTKVWRILISSQGAYSIHLIFDRYKLPKGAKLFIYNTDFTEIIGSFTEKNNKNNGVLATMPVGGDEIIVEYQEPAKPEFKGELLIGAVYHDFLGIHKLLDTKTGVFGDAGSCNVNISCYDEDNDLNIRRSVVRMIVGGVYCTATLVNNTSLDGTPYALSAGHCFSSASAATNAIFLFNYETPHCSEEIEGAEVNSISNSTAKVWVDSLDIALVQLSQSPPSHYRPYYAGWTLNSSPTKPFTTIHHPQGDVKKISTSNSDLVATTSPYPQFIDNFHWKVSEWATGTTEPGSSGSALFDMNNRIVGTLTGGYASCSNSTNDYYTQFYKAWDLNSEIDGQFKHWLDPENTGQQSINGFDPYETDPYARISNVEIGDTNELDISPSGGYISGHNAVGSTLFAEKFSGIKSATIKGVYIMSGKSTAFSNQTIDLIIWEGTNEPQNVVARKNGITLNELRRNKEAYVEFTTPVDVAGSFYVGYEINYQGSPIDTFAVYHSSKEGKLNNSMMVYHNGNWELASEVYDSDNKSLWIDVLAEMVVYGDTQVITEDSNKVVLFPNPTNTSYIKINSNKLYIETYEIISLNGYSLQKGEIQMVSSNKPIYIADLPQGVYILKLLVEDKYEYHKFTKQKF